MLGVFLLTLGTIGIGAGLVLRIVQTHLKALLDKVPGSLENMIKAADPALAKTFQRLKLLPPIIAACLVVGALAAAGGLTLLFWPGTHFGWPLAGLALSGLLAALLVLMARTVKNQFKFEPQMLMNAALRNKQAAFGVPNSARNPANAKAAKVEAKQPQPKTLREALQQARQQQGQRPPTIKKKK